MNIQNRFKSQNRLLSKTPPTITNSITPNPTVNSIKPCLITYASNNLINREYDNKINDTPIKQL